VDLTPDSDVPKAPVDPSLYAESSLREKIIEHAFIADLLRVLWVRGRRDIEVLRTEVDRDGYDIVLHCNGIQRHVQLKSSYREATTARVDARTALEGKPSGCILWILFDQRTLELGPYLWFGGKPGERLPALGDKVARHSRPNAHRIKAGRPGLRTISRGRFTKLDTMDELITALFG
jgi:hypothetical protein